VSEEGGRKAESEARKEKALSVDGRSVGQERGERKRQEEQAGGKNVVDDDDDQRAC
jgi:hypothetical protein